MIINYGKYFKDNFNLHFHFKNGNYNNIERKENGWIVINSITYITLEPSVNLFETIFNMKNFNNSKLMTILNLKNGHFVFHRIDFIKKRTFKIWKSFVKKKKCNRLGLMMLKVISEHLGNPRFVNFSV